MYLGVGRLRMQIQPNPEFESCSAFNGDDPHWYAARIRANHEKRVAERMANRGIEHLLPLYTSLRQWKDRKVCLLMPLFPGYLFVRLCLRERLRVLEVPGLAGLVGIGCQPIPLADAEIQVIQRCINLESIIAPHPYLSVGNRALVRNGPFRGLEGIVIRLKNRTRLVISLSLIQSSVTLELDQAELEPVR
jgi:transcription antitermination factor NusG